MQTLRQVFRRFRRSFRRFKEALILTDDQDYSVFNDFKDAPKKRKKIDRSVDKTEIESEFYYCPKDSTLLHEHWENTGFEPPNGVPNLEVDHWYCPICKFKTESPETDAIPE